MSQINLTLFGLGRIGTSIGLALKRYNAEKDSQHHFVVTGMDSRPGWESDAQKRGAVSKIGRNYADAAADRDIIIVALQYAEVQALYRNIADGLKPGAVILDMSPLKQPSLAWAKQYLPDHAHLVGVTPVVNFKYLFDGLDDAEHAAEDLFDDGSMQLMPSVTCARDAVELAADFSTLVGATPHFMDPAEHDSLIAATESLPALLGVASFRLLQKRQAWGDAQKLTNPNFGRLTHHLYDTHPDDLRDLLLNNRESLLVYLDALIENLGELRGVLAQNNRDALEAGLIDAAEEYTRWAGRRQSGRWDETDARPAETPSLLGGLMGGFIAKRLRGDDKDKR